VKVLIIEDSERLRRSLSVALRKLGHVVDAVGDGREGLTFALHHDFDVLVLDLMLPGLSGQSVLDELRRNQRELPVLILSAKDQVEDRVDGLRRGADDYLVKPFSFDELYARLLALTRRRYATRNPVIAFGSLRLDTVARLVTVRDRSVMLTAGEYAIFEQLALRRGRVLSKASLLDAVHDRDSDAGVGVVEVMICNLRRKLGPDGCAYIKTRRGYGYPIA